MDCFQDFCLACDKASTNGPYCSQSCRLADRERAGGNTSPTTPAIGRFSFTSSKRPESYFPDEQRLTPSSSRSSLNSSSSNNGVGGAAAAAAAAQSQSYQTQEQLQAYYSSFEQSKALKRRQTAR